MEDGLGTVIFEGKIYNLDKMSADELKELMEKMEKNIKINKIHIEKNTIKMRKNMKNVKRK